MLETKNSIIQVKNAFDRLISLKDMAQQRISEFEDKSIEIFKTKVQRKRQNIPKMWTITKSVNICVMGIQETTENNT